MTEFDEWRFGGTMTQIEAERHADAVLSHYLHQTLNFLDGPDGPSPAVRKMRELLIAEFLKCEEPEE